MIPEEVLSQIKTKKVFLQLPEGLKPKATELARELEEKGFEVVISGDPCFGACDIKKLPNETTLHVGHDKMLSDENIVYWEYAKDVDVHDVVKKAAGMLGSSVALITTPQHKHAVPQMVEALMGKHVEVVGVWLGCEKKPVSSNEILFVGSGRFHALGAAYFTGKKVVRADPFTGDVEEILAEEWVKGRELRRTKAMNAKSFGIVVSSKPGQAKWDVANELKKKLKNSFIIYLDNVTPDALLPFGVDAFVITACPRIVVDDWKNYTKPILLPDEVD